jgi:uncharacterized protein
MITIDASPPAGPSFFDRLSDFVDYLREAGFDIPTGQVLDAMRAVQSIDIGKQNELLVALRGNFVSTPDDQALFDAVFRQYWLQDDAPGSRKILAPREPVVHHGHETNRHDGDLQVAEAYSARAKAARPNLEEDWAAFDQELETAIRLLKRKHRVRPSRREVPGKQGHRFDLRRTLTQSTRRCFEIAKLARKARKRTKTRFVCLCDVSGSMNAHNRFLLQMILAVQKAVPDSRTIVFSTDASEITSALRQRRIENVLSMIDDMVEHWSSGTHIGRALAGLNRALGGSASRTTVCLIVSDGFDQGEVEEIRLQITRLRRRVRAIVWINPLLGTDGYQPLARGMRAALPHLDHFLPANDALSLLRLVRQLSTV